MPSGKKHIRAVSEVLESNGGLTIGGIMRMKKAYSKTRREHAEWHQLFKALVDRIELYDDPPRDIGYWYGERALTGFLAAAAWALPGGWSLESLLD
jgi:hypothetical protein